MRTLSLACFALLLGCPGPGPGEGPPLEGDDAWVVGVRVRAGFARTLYVQVVDDLSTGVFDTGAAYPAGGRSRVHAFEGAVYLLSEDEGTITRNRVADNGALEPEGTIDTTQFGIAGFRSTTVFVDANRALYIDLEQDQVLRWDPEAMTAAAVPFPSLDRDGFTASGADPVVVGGRVVLPVSWLNTTARTARPLLGAAVFDPDTGALLDVIESGACGGAGGIWVDSAGGARVLGDAGGGAVGVADPSFPAPCLARLPDAAEAFDGAPIDLRTRTGADHVSGIAGHGDLGVTRVFRADTDLSGLELNPAAYYDLPAWNWARFDVVGSDLRVHDAPGFADTFGPFAADDAFYLPTYDAAADTSRLDIWAHEDDAPVPGLESDGEFQYVAKL